MVSQAGLTVTAAAGYDPTTDFASYSKVTVSGNYAPTAGFTVPADKTLVVNGTFAPVESVTVAGTLTAGATTVATGKALAVNGTATLAGITVTGTATVGASGKLTVTTPAGADVEKITGAAGAKLTLGAASTATALGVNNTDTTPAKFYKAAGKLDATPSDSSGVAARQAVSGATTSGVIEAGTYTWNTTTINAGVAAASNATNTTAYAAWLK